MPTFDAATLTKIAALRTRRAAGESIEAFELVKISWPSPDGTIYYAVTQVDEAASVEPTVSPIEVRLVPDNDPDWFLPVELDASIGDEEVGLSFWDGDGAFSDLLVTHGEGIRIELYYWFPQETLLLPIWDGHLRVEDEAEVDVVRVKAARGFRSPNLNMPRRAHWPQCQAIFGGSFATQAAITEHHDCPYNRQISGGHIGNLNAGSPFTSCPRLTIQNCSDRLGSNGNFMLSHQTIVTSVVNGQTTGGPLISRSAGNETNLKEPVPVVLGGRRVFDMKVMNYRRDINTNTPDRGFFVAEYECFEGPVDAIWGAVINGQSADPSRYNHRFGLRGQSPLDTSLTTFSYSGTAHLRYYYGWVDPTTLAPGDITATAVTNGLCDIRIYSRVTAGAGLIGTYYADTGWGGVYGIRVDNTVDFDWTAVVPITGMWNMAYSVIWTGYYTPSVTENKTFQVEHDNGARLSIDTGSGFTVIIDELATSGTHNSSAISLTASQAYPIKLEFFQKNLGVNPEFSFCKLRHNGASETSGSYVIIPQARLSHDAGYTLSRGVTANRVWQIARMLTDKRWGYGLEYDQLDLESWIDAADWAGETVRFTFDSVNYDHTRAASNVVLYDRKVQQQIEDACMAGRLSRPFLFNGKIHIVPLKALTSGELTAAPVFYETGENRNIIHAEVDGVEKSTLKRSRQSDLDLPNRVEVTFDDLANDWLETPAPPVEDLAQQLKAGTVLGNQARRVNVKKWELRSVTIKNQAIKMAWSFIDLGPFDEGGIQNNLRIAFRGWFIDALDLHPAKVVKVVSTQLTRYGFEYFRILKIRRTANLEVEIEAQAYNETYMDAFETVIGGSPPAYDPPALTPPPASLSFGTITFTDGVLDIPITT